METVVQDEASLAIEFDALAVFRKQVRLEDETRPKMSDAAKAKLRSINEHDRKDAEADARLVKEFNSRPVVLERLVDLFAKAFGGPERNPRRRAIKAMYRLTEGRRVYHISDLSLFGELLLGEAEITMHRFLAKYPLPEDETVTPKGEPPKPVRLCKAGKDCIRYEHRKAAPAKGSGQYCSSACAASVRARAKRALATIPTLQ